MRVPFVGVDVSSPKRPGRQDDLVLVYWHWPGARLEFRCRSRRSLARWLGCADARQTALNDALGATPAVAAEAISTGKQ
jgi:hypothetical protein